MVERDGALVRFVEDETDFDRLRRQDLPRVLARNGPAVLVVTAEQIRRGDFYSGKTVGVEMPLAESVDIDEPLDVELAEWLLARRTA